MNKELKLFYEDSNEQLNLMEDALIFMQENGVDDENISALFRAMHTIKGTAGMFEFNDIVHFTHTAENLLSEVRDGNVELSEELIELLFEVKDHTVNLVERSINQEDIGGELKATQDRLMRALKSHMINSSNEEELQNLDSKNDISKNSSAELWHISFRLHSDFFTSGMDIVSILSFFPHLGEIKNILFIDTKLPHIKNIDPTQAYIGYEILFLTKSNYDEIEEIFEFILDDIELTIFKTDDLEKLKELLKDNRDLKDRLISCGFENVKKLNKIEKSKRSQPKSKEKIEKNFSLRVDSNKIDQLINQISEMVIANAKVRQRADILNDSDLSESATILSNMIEEIRASVMNIRMVQVGDSFNKFKRVVHDIAKKLNKEIDFKIVGGDTELDKTVVEKISDSLVHMLRNSIDHGIESPEERKKLGKDEKGLVVLKIYPDAGIIVIELSDDGRGLSKEKIVQKAVESGLISKDHNLSDKDIYNLIFAPGLSTAKEVSDISGRGVGMDVVKKNIESLRGTIEIDSEVNKGTIFTIRLPLTLAIIDGFLVQSGDTKYIIPLEMIQECLELDEHFKSEMAGNYFINLRDTMLPLLGVREYFNESASKSERENIVVVRYGDFKMGLVVDELYGEFQTVIKSLGKVFDKVPGISGGTILGNGEIALIFDIPKLIEHKIRKLESNRGEKDD